MITINRLMLACILAPAIVLSVSWTAGKNLSEFWLPVVISSGFILSIAAFLSLGSADQEPRTKACKQARHDQQGPLNLQIDMEIAEPDPGLEQRILALDGQHGISAHIEEVDPRDRR